MAERTLVKSEVTYNIEITEEELITLKGMLRHWVDHTRLLPSAYGEDPKSTDLFFELIGEHPSRVSTYSSLR